MIKHTINGKKPASRSSVHKKPQVEHATHTTHKRRHARSSGSALNGLFNAENETNLALGAAALAVAGLTAFFMLKPAQEEERFVDQAYGAVRNAYDYATDYAENIKDTAHGYVEHPHSGSLLATGIIGGTLLGGAAIYLLSGKNPQKNAQNIVDKMSNIFDTVKENAYEAADNVNSSALINAAQEILESIVEKATSYVEEEVVRPSKKSHFFNNALEIGLNGLRIWKNLQKK